MTHSDLEASRKRIPFFIVAFCLLPWFLMRSDNLAQAKLANELIVPGLAVLAAFFYVGLDLRGPHWKWEIDTHLGKQIRAVLLDLIPNDLDVTESERRDLDHWAVFRKLTGVFWEAVDRSDVLRSQKEHFYSNGIVYSTSIDVFLICGFGGFCYAVASIVTRQANLAYVGCCLIAIAVASKTFVTPRARERHLELSAEQLDLLRRDQGEFVSNRFRDIIIGWRRTRVLT